MTAWTEEQVKTLDDLTAAAADIRIIAERLGRSVNAVRVYRMIKSMPAEKRGAYRHRGNIAKRAARRRMKSGLPPLPTKAGKRAPVQNFVSPFVEVPAVMAERAARINAPHRDLTSVICGDPPVGFSMLEKYQRDLVSA